MRVVFLGLSLSSSWGNGHATTYRALLRALDRRGHEVLFLEREQPWYAAHRDLPAPGFCALRFYDRPDDLERYDRAIAQADAVIVGSYVPDGAAVIDLLAPRARLFGFYDIDTPVTLAALADGGAAYLTTAQVPLFDLYLSFTGGPVLRVLERDYGARLARALYCAVDAELHRPVAAQKRWDLGYLGTYSEDRQPALERLLIEPARRLPIPSLRRRRPAVSCRDHLARKRGAHRASGAGRSPGLLLGAWLGTERHPRRHAAGRLQPERAAVRGQRLRHTDPVRSMAGARDLLSARTGHPRRPRHR